MQRLLLLAIIALRLKEVFGLEDINELPIVYNIAWYEQKAVIVLLALLYLGVKNIHLGPTLPAFLSPNVANVLVERFGIAGIRSVEEDMELFLGKRNLNDFMGKCSGARHAGHKRCPERDVRTIYLPVSNVMVPSSVTRSFRDTFSFSSKVSSSIS